MLNYKGKAALRSGMNISAPFDTGIFDDVEYYFCGIGSSTVAVLDFAWGRSFMRNGQVFVLAVDGKEDPVELGQVVVKGRDDQCLVLPLGIFRVAFKPKEDGL